jgi:hypothetical protein
MGKDDPAEQLRPIAEESLAVFDQIARSAKASLEGTTTGGGPTVFASMNTFTSTEALKNQNKILEANLDGYRTLSREPAIARVTVIDEDGQRTTYYFSRAAAPPVSDSRLKFASYRSPIGRLAELGVGDDFEVSRGRETAYVEIVEHGRFQPTLVHREWDARNAVLEGENYGPLTIDSFRSLLKSGGPIDETALEALLKEERAAGSIREGIRRAVISKMDLRDQPVLDRFQGEIFRMPLGSRLLILGAPGTGKTTTLIRRLGQKLDVAALGEDERQISRIGDETDHARSWLMFTPTELLRLFVKEAFNREGIPAPDDRIRTWPEFREDLARNEFRVLRSAASSSSLVMKSSAQSLAPGLETDQISWFTDFDQWQKATFWDEMRNAAISLREASSPEVVALGSKVFAIIGAAGPMPQVQAIASLAAVASEIGTLVNGMKKATDDQIDRALNLQVNRNKDFLDAMATFIASSNEPTDEETDEEADDDEEVGAPRTGRVAAVAAYRRAVRSLARARARKRTVSKTTIAGRLVEWLGDRALTDQELPALGANLIVQSALRAFANPVRRYVDGTTARYRRFRRVRQGEHRWYRRDGFSPTEVHPLEVDIILLATLRASDELIAGVPALVEGDTPSRNTLGRMTQLYRTQVLVDEVADFSPIQLACMATIARPATRSFFACGDFNQRVTSFGTRSLDEVKWARPDITTRVVTVAYRQSRYLHSLAQQLVTLFGRAEDRSVLADFVENDGVPPVLATGMAETRAVASWLADRIVEIDDVFEELPAIAVLVSTEDEVRPVAKALGDALVDHNISVEACPDGKVRGRDGAVRVFNVEHIKGLEFEAVFFLGIDKLAASQPDLFDKYLYVGSTRAATYLGITCEKALPRNMVPLERLFGRDWSWKPAMG